MAQPWPMMRSGPRRPVSWRNSTGVRLYILSMFWNSTTHCPAWIETGISSSSAFSLTALWRSALQVSTLSG